MTSEFDSGFMPLPAPPRHGISDEPRVGTDRYHIATLTRRVHRTILVVITLFVVVALALAVLALMIMSQNTDTQRGLSRQVASDIERAHVDATHLAAICSILVSLRDDALWLPIRQDGEVYGQLTKRITTTSQQVGCPGPT